MAATQEAGMALRAADSKARAAVNERQAQTTIALAMTGIGYAILALVEEMQNHRPTREIYSSGSHNPELLKR